MNCVEMLTTMTKSEWEEMNVLRKAISEYPSAISSEEQERFSQLFVQSLAYVYNTEENSVL